MVVRVPGGGGQGKGQDSATDAHGLLRAGLRAGTGRSAGARPALWSMPLSRADSTCLLLSGCLLGRLLPHPLPTSFPGGKEEGCPLFRFRGKAATQAFPQGQDQCPCQCQLGRHRRTSAVSGWNPAMRGIVLAKGMASYGMKLKVASWRLCRRPPEAKSGGRP